MPESKIPADKKSQLERFKETAKQVETDDSEKGFDAVLMRVSRANVAKGTRKGSDASKGSK